MARIIWGATGERIFEAGADRAVLYVGESAGVPWNGLKSVKEAPSGGDPTPYYMDGVKYLNLATSEEYEASIDAYSAPPNFFSCDGTKSLYAGLYVTQQPRMPFGLTYRTLIGNDIVSLDHGYKIHLIYNALASPANRDHTTLGPSGEPLGLSWSITTTPPAATDYRATAHLVVDSRTTPEVILAEFEDIIYGSDAAEARLPLPAELIDLFAG